MSVAEARKTKINYEGATAHRLRDVRSFQRYAAAVILPIPPTAVAIGRLFQTDDTNTRQALDLIAANPDRQFTFALLGLSRCSPWFRPSWRPPVSRDVDGPCSPQSRSL